MEFFLTIRTVGNHPLQVPTDSQQSLNGLLVETIEVSCANLIQFSFISPIRPLKGQFSRPKTSKKLFFKKMKRKNISSNFSREKNHWDQCDHIRRFLKVLGDKLSFKSSPNVWWLSGYFKNITFNQKLLWLPFWATLDKIGLIFQSIMWSHWLGHMRQRHCSKGVLWNLNADSKDQLFIDFSISRMHRKIWLYPFLD